MVWYWSRRWRRFGSGLARFAGLWPWPLVSAETYLAIVVASVLALVAFWLTTAPAHGATPSESAPTALSVDAEVPVWRVVRAVQANFPEHEWRAAMQVATCEVGGTWDWRITTIDSDGLPHSGLWQVAPRWWGAVPPTPEGQAAQVAEIVREYSWAFWSCRPS